MLITWIFYKCIFRFYDADIIDVCCMNSLLYSILSNGEYLMLYLWKENAWRIRLLCMYVCSPNYILNPIYIQSRGYVPQGT